MKKHQELVGLVLWLQECKYVKEWIERNFDNTNDDRFKRWHNAYRQVHWGIIHTIQELYDWKVK